jgi:hypothetical protein
MSEGPFPDRGPDDQEPDGSQPQPADRNGPDNRDSALSGDQDSDAVSSAASPDEYDAPPEEPMQGLYICLPAEQADLSAFTDGTATPPIAPGPLLAEVVTAVAGGDGAGLAQLSEDCLFSVLSAGRRMSSWGTWLELPRISPPRRSRPVPRRTRPVPMTGGSSSASSSLMRWPVSCGLPGWPRRTG